MDANATQDDAERHKRNTTQKDSIGHGGLEWTRKTRSAMLERRKTCAQASRRGKARTRRTKLDAEKHR